MTVLIDQCYFSGTRSAIAAAQRSLEQAQFPAESDNAYYIFRRLDIAATTTGLGQAYYRQTEQLLTQKVHGGLPEAPQAMCVWFASEAELFACLCRDIVRGQAADYWFWQQFSEFILTTKSASLSRIFQHNTRQLPLLIRQLFLQQQLPDVWSEITLDDAKQIYYQQSVSKDVQTLLQKVILGSEKPLKENHSAPILTELFAEKTKPGQPLDSKQRLAIVIYCQLDKPHWLVSRQGIPPLINWLQSVTGYVLPERGILNKKNIDTKKTPKNTSAAIRATTTNTPAQSAQQDLPAYAEAGHSRPQKSQELLSDIIQVSPESSGQKVFDTVIDEADVLAESPPENMPDSHWQIQQGGLFYFLNVLNLPFIRDLLLNDQQAMSFPSAWGWLYRCGEAYGIEQERALLRCLSALSNMEEAEFLTQMPRLQVVDDVLAYADRRYHPITFRQLAVLQKPAQLHYARPELSLTFSQQDVDIDIRRVALDADPGWIDWLGTWVRFYYR